MGQVRRRQFLLSAAAMLAAPRASAQTAAPGLPRVIIVTNGDEAGHRPYREQFLRGMRDSGQVEGATFRLDVRYANRDTTRTPVLIREAATERPAALVVYGLTSARIARDATSTVPVVVATSSDLVDAGLAKSFSHPGGNITGINDLSDELAAKRLELLKAALPKAARVALLLNPNFPATPKIERRVSAAARALGIELIRVDAKDPASLLAALDSLEASRPDAILLGGDALFVVRARELIERTNAMRIPLVHYWPGTAEMGALISHQANISHNVARAAYYVARILQGAKPADLPIEQPNHYDLVVNVKIAKAFGIALPAGFLVHADRVIE
jgi:putative ABC transport system substrate-binding protein